ncbi:MAG: cytochrome c [Melioribacteraceae bacterium]|nr:cytochrome c [Melioribacteraceae bacterium]
MKYFIIIVIFFSGVISAQQARKNTPEEFKKAELIFKQKCTRCHGSEGRAFGNNFAKMDKKELRQLTEDMMFGPARLKPTETEIKAMIEYLISLHSNKD